MLYGLKDETINQLKGVFLKYPEIDEVVIYGSRAMGNYKKGSDIDITLKGSKLNLGILSKIDLDLDDLLLPYTFDISIFHQIDNPDLINHINRVGKIIFKRE
jgi:predicted nucleotidyltransferase